MSLTILGVVSYHRGGGVMVDAVSDSYDEKTRVKSTTIKLTSLDKPVMIHIEASMGDVRLSFSPDAAEDTDTPPYFALVEVTLPDFEDAEVFGNTFDLFATELSAATGESVWLNTYGGSSNERLNGVTATSDGGSAGDYAAQITAVNDYQVNVFMYDESTDGDFAKRPQGGNDAMLLTYDWREKPVDTSALEAAIE